MAFGITVIVRDPRGRGVRIENAQHVPRIGEEVRCDHTQGVVTKVVYDYTNLRNTDVHVSIEPIYY